jgi:hypothetical protein
MELRILVRATVRRVELTELQKRLGLLVAAETGSDLLPHLTSGTIDDDPVFKFRGAIRVARAEWCANRVG